MGRRFVDMRVIHQRMLQKDLRFQADARRHAAKAQQPAPVVPVVDVVMVPLTEGPVVDVALEPTGAELFGDPVPGEAVESHGPTDPCHGYTVRGRWGRHLSGKPFRIGALQGPPSETLKK